MGRQCTLFRQEAMRLHNQLEDALAEADVYRRKSEILEKEVKDTNERMKRMIYANKMLEAERTKMVKEMARRDKEMPEMGSRLHSEPKSN